MSVSCPNCCITDRLPEYHCNLRLFNEGCTTSEVTVPLSCGNILDGDFLITGNFGGSLAIFSPNIVPSNPSTVPGFNQLINGDDAGDNCGGSTPWCHAQIPRPTVIACATYVFSIFISQGGLSVNGTGVTLVGPSLYAFNSFVSTYSSAAPTCVGGRSVPGAQSYMLRSKHLQSFRACGFNSAGCFYAICAGAPIAGPYTTGATDSEIVAAFHALPSQIVVEWL